jgi:oxaloacetate decarboxylase alpha subunit
MAAPRAHDIVATPPEQPTIEELRRRHGTEDDDELILRALVPRADIERMRASGPLIRSLPLASSQEADAVLRLMQTVTSNSFMLRTGALSLALER